MTSPFANPYAEEVRQAHLNGVPFDQISPPAQKVAALSGIPSPAPAAAAAPAPIAPPGIRPPAMSGAAPALGSGVEAGATPPTPISAPERHPNGMLQNDRANYSAITQPGNTSGISQIHNPIVRGGLTALDTIARALPIVRNFEPLIPGTAGHHNMLVRQQAGTINQEEKADQEEAQTAHLNASADEANARAKSLSNPPEKPVTNELELFLKDPAAAQRYHDLQAKNPGVSNELELFMKDPVLAQQFADFKNKNLPPKEPKEGETPLGPRTEQLNQLLEKRFQVRNPGKPLPDTYKLGVDATQKDYDRIEKSLSGEENAQGSLEQHNQTAELRKQTMALAAQNHAERGEHEIKQGSLKAYGPTLDSAERFNIMSENYEKAVKDHDQQAMLSLLSNHLAMTIGLAKGARITKDIIDEAKNSRPWLQGMEAKFDKDGVLSGVTLTQPQMRQMVDLGRSRFTEDLQKSRSQARYLGAKDDGPDRTPNSATIRYYTAQANGDPAKAKALAQADGWSVQ